ncbi:MAG: glycosyltransferase family 4 protein [Candidatus Uhrbacteria bacterium]|nr:glycosyltransferase family 4 protein [Candidatus Uhrbacteria bacterium]
MSPKKILLAVTLAEPGGAQSFVLGFAKWLKDRGHNVTVVAGDGAWLFDECARFSINTIRLKHMGRSINPWRDVQAFFELKKVLLTERPDAIHLNSTKMGVLGSLQVTGDSLQLTKIVYRIGGWVFLEPLSPIVKWLYVTLERWTARFKDVIVCVHPGDENVARRLNIKPKQAILTIPNGVDISAFDQTLLPREEARTKLHFDKTAFVFGTVAHFYPAKNLVQYLEACAVVHATNPHARFIIIGDGPERKAIESNRRELGLESVVILPGAIDHASMLLLGFDAFVLPSAKEGMSWSLLEAMAAKLPCIATDVGANAWMLENDAGWIVKKQSPTELAQALRFVIEHPIEAQAAGKKARSEIETRFPLSLTYQENERTLMRSN